MRPRRRQQQTAHAAAARTEQHAEQHTEHHPEQHTEQRRWLVWAAVVSAVTVGAIVVPVLDPAQPDSFPLSTYPMFSFARPRTVSLSTARAIGSDGSERRLSPQLIAGTDEPVLAHATVSNALREGGGEPERLCREIASRVGRQQTRASAARPQRAEPRDRLRSIEVVSERYDVVRYFADGAERAPASRQVFARCAIE